MEKKYAKDINESFTKEGAQVAKKHEKTFNLTSQQGTEDQIHNKILLYFH